MATKIASLMCNRFGGIRRINATFSNDFISAYDIQDLLIQQEEKLLQIG